MQNLLFLDLRETSISDLTPCIQKLKKLRVLMYDGSYEIFKQIPISILGNLSVLCLQHSKIKELDKEFGRLVNLRVIDFFGTEIDIIRSKVFSSLNFLEVLYMHSSFHDWKASNDEDEDRVAFEELSTLKHLYALRVDITNKYIISDKYRVVGNFPSIKHFSIRSFDQSIPLDMPMYVNYLTLDPNIENIAQWLKLLLIKTKNLEMAFECIWAPEECPDNMKVQWASMISIHVVGCRNWKPIFGQQSVPTLQSFYCEKEWFEQLNWEDEDTKKQIQSVIEYQQDSYMLLTESDISEIRSNQRPNIKALMKL
ncbi:hypothetical protein ZOSMA_408G00020 [Zostera marina]|uniref:NB-ARC domain-containing disease resistance protein n=1 Tax=Zostera marina TaxID=29655 RepID=A0A0K9P321_ZOSMR|nr:hypothetical protein ZOSMA_408G00020 [Zostera marina]